jgi:ssDNA-binding Zn-finger/Zn-ribbon topoisomerase 1
MAKKLGRPKKQRPTCTSCGQTFARQQNLDWHLPTHDKTEGSSMILDNQPILSGHQEVETMSDGCTDCHKKEHEIEKKDSMITQLTEDLGAAANRLREPQQPDGHKDIQSLIDCPSCGKSAVEQFEKRGGAVLPAGVVKPFVVNYVKKNYPIFEEGLEIPNVQ